MEEPWGMRLWLFVLSFVLTSGFASYGMAAMPISGEVTLLENKLYLKITDQKCPRYQLVPKNNEASSHMRKLSAGDLINASGYLDSAECMANIESVEYVGLKKLLGYWYSKAGIITVRDFSSLSFYPMNVQDMNDETPGRTGDPITYRYSVTPSGGKEWVVFLSNSEGTSFATLKFGGKFVTMKIYDSESGAILQTLRLSKWGDLKP